MLERAPAIQAHLGSCALVPSALALFRLALNGRLISAQGTPTASPPSAHGSRPELLARSSLSDSFILYSKPVYPGAFTDPKTPRSKGSGTRPLLGLWTWLLGSGTRAPPWRLPSYFALFFSGSAAAFIPFQGVVHNCDHDHGNLLGDAVSHSPADSQICRLRGITYEFSLPVSNIFRIRKFSRWW